MVYQEYHVYQVSSILGFLPSLEVDTLWSNYITGGVEVAAKVEVR